MTSNELASAGLGAHSGGSSITAENDAAPRYDGEREINCLIKCFLDVPDIAGIRAKIQIDK